ncbi:MAG: hypothetical protein GY679_01745 [Mycoplasma sp.]|nr:hypothetical protein [Mycoplasma sp.]
MNIYRLSQTKNNDYDTYDSAVVVAKDESEARNIHPQDISIVWGDDFWNEEGQWSTWTAPKDVKVEFIGKAGDSYEEKIVICASFNS